MESKNVILNSAISGSCHRYIDKYCQDEISHKDEGLVIQCLIKVRDDHQNMDDKCKAAVEHWQILSLKDWHFSYQFKESCKEDIKDHCVQKQLKSKADIVSCLSEIARNDVLVEKEPRTLKAKCRAQLKFQLLQKHTNIKLNPKVVSTRRIYI